MQARRFWDYYVNVTSGSHNKYRDKYFKALYHAGGNQYSEAKWIKANKSTIFKKMEMYMLTNKVPEDVTKHMLNHLNKWLSNI
ncbi:hypothetical protein [Lysinibacillus antri]|uniref:Uncharacterized protein n=1 Tax=Lysinibacillus antri TaxID=2498145 RepID=A0A432LFA3_9BACI|nr:hypothetical protein [Lysinibacillus antri]RUL55949.1 hypothetical protein EK386_03785 [Lysinibacillus antri]